MSTARPGLVAIGLLSSLLVVMSCRPPASRFIEEEPPASIAVAPPFSSSPLMTPLPSSPLDPNGFLLHTSDEAALRVRPFFPHGIATEDARAELGSSPAAVEDGVPDGANEWIAEIVPPAPITAAQLRAAMPPQVEPSRGGEPAYPSRWVKGRMVGKSVWLHHYAPAATLFDRVVLEVDLVAGQERAVTATELEREAAWARALATALRAPPPRTSMTGADAAARAARALGARHRFSDEALQCALRVQARPGKRFAARLVWDAAYSAGFAWGDADRFHWVPSPDTDVTQGIDLGTSTPPGGFEPERLSEPAGAAEVDNLELSFNVARVREPIQVFEVLLRAARYFARRLDGTVVAPDGQPFEAANVRAATQAVVQQLRALGVEPGSRLACQLF